MGTATRKAMKRNTVRQALIQSTYAKPADAENEYERAMAQAEAREAKATLKVRSNTWGRREQSPGNFHRPNGRMVLPARSDAR